MGRTCRNICQLHRAEAISNKLRYQMGQKRCTFCGIFMTVEDTRCMCCKAILRTTPRGKKPRVHV